MRKQNNKKSKERELMEVAVLNGYGNICSFEKKKTREDVAKLIKIMAQDIANGKYDKAG